MVSYPTPSQRPRPPPSIALPLCAAQELLVSNRQTSTAALRNTARQALGACIEWGKRCRSLTLHKLPSRSAGEALVLARAPTASMRPYAAKSIKLQVCAPMHPSAPLKTKWRFPRSSLCSTRIPQFCRNFFTTIKVGTRFFRSRALL